MTPVRSSGKSQTPEFFVPKKILLRKEGFFVVICEVNNEGLLINHVPPRNYNEGSCRAAAQKTWLEEDNPLTTFFIVACV